MASAPASSEEGLSVSLGGSTRLLPPLVVVDASPQTADSMALQAAPLLAPQILTGPRQRGGRRGGRRARGVVRWARGVGRGVMGREGGQCFASYLTRQGSLSLGRGVRVLLPLLQLQLLALRFCNIVYYKCVCAVWWWSV